MSINPYFYLPSNIQSNVYQQHYERWLSKLSSKLQSGYHLDEFKRKIGKIIFTDLLNDNINTRSINYFKFYPESKPEIEIYIVYDFICDYIKVLLKNFRIIIISEAMNCVELIRNFNELNKDLLKAKYVKSFEEFMNGIIKNKYYEEYYYYVNNYDLIDAVNENYFLIKFRAQIRKNFGEIDIKYDTIIFPESSSIEKESNLENQLKNISNKHGKSEKQNTLRITNKGSNKRSMAETISKINKDHRKLCNDITTGSSNERLIFLPNIKRKSNFFNRPSCLNKKRFLEQTRNSINNNKRKRRKIRKQSGGKKRAKQGNKDRII